MPMRSPCQRLAAALTGRQCTGNDIGRQSFMLVDFRRLLIAGLPALRATIWMYHPFCLSPRPTHYISMPM